MEMSPVLPADLVGSAEHRQFLHTFRSLQNAWYRYWEDVSTFWSSLMNCFSSGGNWMVLKTSCIQSGLDKVLSGRLSDLRSTLEEMGLASTHLAEVDGKSEPMVLLVRTLLTLLSNADQTSGVQQRPSELPTQPRQQARMLSRHIVQNGHSPLEPQPLQIPHGMPPQQQVLGAQLKPQPAFQQREGWRQAWSYDDVTNPKEPFRSTDRNSMRRSQFEAKLDTRTPRSSLTQSLTSTGASVTVRCTTSSIEPSNPSIGAPALVPRQRSASPLLRRPCKAAASAAQSSPYTGPVWTNVLQESVRNAVTGYVAGSVMDNWSGVPSKVSGTAWSLQGRANPGAAYSGEAPFRSL